MLLMHWFGCACGGLEVKRAGSACGGLKVKRAGADGLKVKRAGADAADALVWICLWWPEGEAGRG